MKKVENEGLLFEKIFANKILGGKMVDFRFDYTILL